MKTPEFLPQRFSSLECLPGIPEVIREGGSSHDKEHQYNQEEEEDEGGGGRGERKRVLALMMAAGGGAGCGGGGDGFRKCFRNAAIILSSMMEIFHLCAG